MASPGSKFLDVTADANAPTRLARRLGTVDAVVIGLGAMIGAGVFAALAPAARAAGNGLLVGLALAALIAYCNATSSAELDFIRRWKSGRLHYALGLANVTLCMFDKHRVSIIQRVRYQSHEGR